MSFVYFYEAKWPSPEEKESAAQKLIFFNPAQVNRFQIHVGNTITVCEREASAWVLKHPIQAKADSKKIDELFWNLLDARSVRSVELEEPFGEPRAEFTLWVGEKPVRLQFGENTPLGPNLYVKMEGEPLVRVVPAALFAKLILNPEDLRDKRIFVQEKDPLAVTANDFKMEKSETVEEKESP